MENTFTFHQPKSQARVVFIILAASFLMVGGVFGIFILFGTENAAAIAAILILVAGVMIGIVRFTKSQMLAYQITVGQEGFSIEDVATSQITRYQWSDITKYRRGTSSYESVDKAYLWIWMKDGKSYFIEDNGADKERAQHYQEFSELAAHYLAQNDQVKAHG